MIVQKLYKNSNSTSRIKADVMTEQTHVYINFEELNMDDPEETVVKIVSELLDEFTNPQREAYEFLNELNENLTKKMLRDKKLEEFYVTTLSKPYDQLTEEEKNQIMVRLEEDLLKPARKANISPSRVFESLTISGELFTELIEQGKKSENFSELESTLIRSFCRLKKIAPSPEREAELEKLKNNAYFMEDIGLHFLVSRESFFDETKQEKLRTLCKSPLLQNFFDDVTLFTNIVGQPLDSPENYSFTSDEIRKMHEFQEASGHSLQIKEGLLFREGTYFNGEKYYSYADDLEENYQNGFLGLLDDSFSLDDVERANQAIDAVVKTIKDNNLSPLEAMEYIHLYITSNFGYKHGNEQSSIMGGYVTGNFVCAGFSSLTKAIVDRLNDERLKCSILPCALKDPESNKVNSFHARCIIQISDEKYDVDGLYTNDACWDIKSSHSDSVCFANFLRPLCDMDVTNEYTYTPSQDKAFALYEVEFTQKTMDEPYLINPTTPYMKEYRNFEIKNKKQELEKSESTFLETFEDVGNQIDINTLIVAMIPALKIATGEENVDEQIMQIVQTSMFSPNRQSEQGAFRDFSKKVIASLPKTDGAVSDDVFYAHVREQILNALAMAKGNQMVNKSDSTTTK